MNMTRIVAVSSGKGGVGKTTITANLGAALTEFGQRALVVDANLTTPNLGFHLGVPLYPHTLHDVLRGEAHVEDTIYMHPSGLKVIPASISINDLKNTKPKKLSKVVLDLVGDHDIILLDAAAGLGKESLASLEAADELLVVTNPQLPSVTDALKTIKLAEEMGTQILGVVLNRVESKASELSVDEVESLLGYPIISVIPEDKKVHSSLAAKTPVVSYSSNSRASIELKKLAAQLAGVDYEPPVSSRFNLVSRMFGFLRR